MQKSLRNGMVFAVTLLTLSGCSKWFYGASFSRERAETSFNRIFNLMEFQAIPESQTYKVPQKVGFYIIKSREDVWKEYGKPDQISISEIGVNSAKIRIELLEPKNGYHEIPCSEIAGEKRPVFCVQIDSEAAVVKYRLVADYDLLESYSVKHRQTPGSVREVKYKIEPK